MNIFEKYGGYEAVKQAAVNYKNSGDRVTAAGLELQCLEYRRQYNIFEVGDLVVFVDEKERKPVLLKFKESRNFDLVHLEVIGSGLCGPSYQKEVRHATDAEIKAGKRLPD